MDTTNKEAAPKKRSYKKKIVQVKSDIWTPPAGPWDNLDVNQRGEIVNAIMQIYFKAENWMLERNKKFPGLA